MIEVLKATDEQYNTLNNYRNGVNLLQFNKDADNIWIVGMQVLTSEAFISIRPQLELLEVIQFNPVITQI
jgi:hypothetical protein